MFDEMTGEKKLCIKRKIHYTIFSVLIFEHMTLLSRGLMFEICWVSKEDDKNNDRIFFLTKNKEIQERKRK